MIYESVRRVKWKEGKMTVLKQNAIISNHLLSPNVKTGLGILVVLLLGLLDTMFLLAVISVG
jgi:hypothetical protein